MSIAALRQRLSTLVAPPRAGGAGGAIATGIAALDRALSDGGVPCGRLTEVVGAPGSGKTTLVRQLVAAALAAQRWVAYVDGARTLAPRDWAAAARTGRLWVVRPPDVGRSAWCADVLLRSGAFGLVVLDGGTPLSRQIAVRLTRLAREHDAALVVVGDPGAGAVVGSAVRLRVERKAGRRQEAGGDGAGSGEPEGLEVGAAGGWRRRWRVPAFLKALGTGSGRVSRVLRIVVDKGGRHHSVEVHCAIDVARRLCAHPEVPDRRGVASRNRRGERAGPDVPGARARGTPERATPERIAVTLPRKRRCAEPAIQRDAFLLPGEGRGR